jgi:Ni/Fe-hydrogenase subunit HybB-like protein
MVKVKITFWRVVLLVLLILGAYATFLRFFRGLGASTNLSDAFPWGIWIGFDVMCGVMLAAGGFTLTAAVYLFNLKKFKPIVRPTVLTAFLGYQLVVVGLLFDIGRSYRIWHPLVMWNPRSVMFEVAWCVTLYSIVLSLEFGGVLFERFQLTKLMQIQKSLLIPLVIAGVLLSTLHQSSLGSLYLIVPNKLYPLWYTPLLPVLFFLSAICVGLAMTIFESSMSAKHFGKQLELPIIQSLGRTLLVMLSIYTAVRLDDLLHRGVLGLLAKPRWETALFILEVCLVSVAPITLLLIRRVRQSANGLYVTSVLCLLGFVANRLNVAITGMEAAAGRHYIPKWTEVTVTLAIIAFGFLVFAVCVKYLPIFSHEAVPEAGAETVQVETLTDEMPELSNVET